MECFFDTANIPEIEKSLSMYPCLGVTTNPSILKSEGSVDFFPHLLQIQQLIGNQRSLHVQLIAQDCQGMLAEAAVLHETLGQRVFVKVPVTEQGLRAMRHLKNGGYNVTATAIYGKMQGLLALEAGADYIAPYCNRMQNMDVDPWDVIACLRQLGDEGQYPGRILAASFKNVGQIMAALEHGAHAITVPPAMLRSALGLPAIQRAVDDFTADWEDTFGAGTNITDLLR